MQHGSLCSPPTGEPSRREVWHRRGSPENPVSRKDIEEKFAANVNGLLSADTAERLKYLAARLDVLANANEIVEIVGRAFEQALSGDAL